MVFPSDNTPAARKDQCYRFANRASTRKAATRLIMDIALSPEARYEGEIRSGDTVVAFSGTLELLKVLEDILSQPHPAERGNPLDLGPG